MKKNLYTFTAVKEAVNKIILVNLFRQKMSAGFIFSYVFFLICMSLDFYITNISANGDWMMEGNALARLWWQIMGPFRFIEIPIWAVVVFAMTYLVHSRSRFFALLWLNVLAFNHLFGFMTWLPYGTFNMLNTLIRTASAYPIGYMSVLFSLPVTLVQVFIGPRHKK